MSKPKTPEPPVPPMSLLKITAAQNDLERLIAENDGEMSPEVEAAWDALGHSFAAKVDAYMARRAGLLARKKVCAAEQAACDDEAKRFGAKVKRCDADITSLEDRLTLAMEQRGMKEFDGERFRVCRKASPWKLGAVLADAPAMRADVAALPGDVRACVATIEATAESYQWVPASLKALHVQRLADIEALRAVGATAGMIIAAEAALAAVARIATFPRGESLVIT